MDTLVRPPTCSYDKDAEADTHVLTVLLSALPCCVLIAPSNLRECFNDGGFGMRIEPDDDWPFPSLSPLLCHVARSRNQTGGTLLSRFLLR